MDAILTILAIFLVFGTALIGVCVYECHRYEEDMKNLKDEDEL